MRRLKNGNFIKRAKNYYLPGVVVFNVLGMSGEHKANHSEI